MSERSPRILVMRGGAIGDFVLTLPALGMLRRRWPRSHIEIVGYPRIAALALASGLADRVTSLDAAGIARYFSLRPELSPEQRAYVRSFDFIISYLYDPDGTVRHNLVEAGARQVIYGPPQVVAGHAVEHLLKPLEALALYPDGQQRPVLELAPAAAAGWGADVLVLHPGSGGARKNWPLAGFLDVARRAAAELAKRPVFLLGEADAGIAEDLARRKTGFEAVSGLTLLEAARTLAACGAYVGNDSGITHVAAAVGIPAVAVFGPTDPAVWGPRGPRVRIVTARERTPESLAEVTADEVFRALRALVAGGPAHLQR